MVYFVCWKLKVNLQQMTFDRMNQNWIFFVSWFSIIFFVLKHEILSSRRPFIYVVTTEHEQPLWSIPKKKWESLIMSMRRRYHHMLSLSFCSHIHGQRSALILMLLSIFSSIFSTFDFFSNVFFPIRSCFSSFFKFSSKMRRFVILLAEWMHTYFCTNIISKRKIIMYFKNKLN